MQNLSWRPSLFSITLLIDKDKFLFEMHFYQKYEKYQNSAWQLHFGFSGKSWNFQNRKQNSLYNSKNIYEIFRKFLKNSKLILKIQRFIWKIQRFIWKIQYSYTEQNSVFCEFYVDMHFIKKFTFMYRYGDGSVFTRMQQYLMFLGYHHILV